MSPAGSLTDVPGLLVGHHPDGVTVILVPEGATAAVDSRGGATGTRELDLLEPANLVQRVHALCFAGGGPFGLGAADGVLTWLAEHGHGFPVPFAGASGGSAATPVVPIVPTATLVDLPSADFRQAPASSAGYAACEAASSDEVEVGRVGAGVRARFGDYLGGVGTASERVGEAVIGALVVTNTTGAPIHPGTGEILTSDDTSDTSDDAADRVGGLLGVVAVTAEVSKAHGRRLTLAAHDAVARALRPAATDQITLFALATGTPTEGTPHRQDEWRLAEVDALSIAAAGVVRRAIAGALLAANPGDQPLSPVGTRGISP